MTWWAAMYAAPLAVLFGLMFSGFATATARPRLRATLGALAPLSTLPALVPALAPDPGEVRVDWLLLGTRLEMDGLAGPLIVVAVILYFTALAAIGWRRKAGGGNVTGRGGKAGAAGADRMPALSGFLVAAYLGNVTVYAAADTATFYLSFAVMSFAAFGAIIHDLTDKARFASKVYLVMSVISEVSVLSALMIITAAAGPAVADAPAAVSGHPLSWLIIALLIVGFGVKAGTVPLHIWLPLAHPAAPPAASAVLSGAMVKAGMLGWLRFLPLGEDPERAWGLVLLALALVGAFAAVVVGAVQKDPKVVLAYSTISQLGFMGAVVSVGLLEPTLAAACAWATVVYAVHHGIAKGALFLGVQMWRELRRSPWRWPIIAGMAVSAAAVAGAPFTSGALGKYVSKKAVEDLGIGWLPLDSLLPLVATGSTILLIRVAVLLHREEKSEEPAGPAVAAAWLALVPLGVAVPWLIGEYRVPLDPPSPDPAVLWDATWPIALGAVIAAGLWWMATRSRAFGDVASADSDPIFPPGDLLGPELVVARSALRGAADADERVRDAAGRVGESIAEGAASANRVVDDAVARSDERLARASVSGLVLLGVVAALMAIVVITGGA
ncbi:proton-conducting transporter membrane subunit [Corynebacterium sp. NPDC060344]|uniref:proton-conducting transporter transmembrane domain-containing protein n=1 Tax=Corynebacterium sp. NPDC060344 TaxID=3347101 RepID=UPI003669686A